MGLLGAIAGGAFKLGKKLFTGIKERRAKKKKRKLARIKKQDEKLAKLEGLFMPQGDSTNIPDAPGNDIVAQAGNALLARFANQEKEAEVVTVADDDRDIKKIPQMTPIMWVGLGVVALALFGKKLFK